VALKTINSQRHRGENDEKQQQEHLFHELSQHHLSPFRVAGRAIALRKG
jgi:hypothetical protein